MTDDAIHPDAPAVIASATELADRAPLMDYVSFDPVYVWAVAARTTLRDLLALVETQQQKIEATDAGALEAGRRLGSCIQALQSAEALLATRTQERDRETELRRKAETHNRELIKALNEKPYGSDLDEEIFHRQAAEALLATRTQELEQAKEAAVGLRQKNHAMASLRDKAQSDQKFAADMHGAEMAARLEALKRYRNELAEMTERARQAEAALHERTQERDEAERTVTSLATMLGWGNVPPRETLERDVAALKALGSPQPAGAEQKKEEPPCSAFKPSEDDEDMCQHCGWTLQAHRDAEAPR